MSDSEGDRSLLYSSQPGGDGRSPCQRQRLEDRRERMMDMLAAGVVVASAFTALMVSAVSLVPVKLVPDRAGRQPDAGFDLGANALFPTVDIVGPNIRSAPLLPSLRILDLMGLLRLPETPDIDGLAQAASQRTIVDWTKAKTLADCNEQCNWMHCNVHMSHLPSVAGQIGSFKLAIPAEKSLDFL